MNQSEPIFFRVLNVIAAFITLQLFWFFFSLGIITVIPATIAMYAVVLEWSKNGIELGIWKTFFHSFKYYFRRTLFLGLYVGGITFILALNASILPALTGSHQLFMQAVWLFAVSIFLFTLLSIMPLVVTSHLKGLKLWKHAWIATFTILPDILLVGSIAVVFAAVSLYIPVALVALISLFAFIHMNIWQRAVKKLPQDFLDQCLLKYRYR
ncbi:DUF624 domain-containing protein [Gracilibacillus caseinilyticus]|uniref:DUF624 domain-containing protein n=1 Tax=Gracilibacillus caseinilyticus TaxID=2932256 RepID=A0ABY4EWV1_9BACI|nr:DUF624 domain-containing protein [Gracilibacillus caseinilyticus]UOQ48332.1 DUF624 domain-containing protein [Gracilibacillus caseinilyticus]